MTSAKVIANGKAKEVFIRSLNKLEVGLSRATCRAKVPGIDPAVDTLTPSAGFSPDTGGTIPEGSRTVLGDRQSCQNLPDPESQKPAIKRASGCFLLEGAGQCRTSNHSHSIIKNIINSFNFNKLKKTII